MSSRKKSVDKSSDFETFIEETSSYLPPSNSKDDSKQTAKQLNKHSSKQVTTEAIASRKKKVHIGDLFDEPAAKEKMVNTTLQLPESLYGRLKTFCTDFGKSKNEVIKTLVEALLDQKNY